MTDAPDNLTKILYNCKICGKQGMSSYDPVCPIKDFNAWKSMLTCNSCYDFRHEFNKVGSAVAKQAYSLVLSRQTMDNDMEGKIKPVIDMLTKKICSLVCNHYRVTNVWDESFADQILEKPDKAWFFLNFYRRGVQDSAKQAHA